MTLTELLANEELRQKEFPVAREMTFLAHAGNCPLPARVAAAISNCAQESTLGEQEPVVSRTLMTATRKSAAGLLNCTSEEIALVGPTSLGLSLIATGIRYRKRDNVLVYFDDYPSNVYPWMALAERGVEVRFINTRQLGVIRPVDIMGQVDEQTRLVALASCHFISGYRIDHDAIGKFLRERGILFCLDGIQTLGAFPTTVENVDMLAADAHKWMLGPCAAGILYVRKAVQEQLHPEIYGWHNVRCPNFVAQEQIEFRSGGARFEAGTHNLLGIVGMHAAMELISEIGVENIARELLRKRALLVTELQKNGFQVLQADAPAENASGIVSFYRPNEDLASLHKKLLDAKILTSLRVDRKGQNYIRISPHFYNSDVELEKLLALI